jgi:CubicO group peptidase (beta-lactamase class C family)
MKKLLLTIACLPAVLGCTDPNETVTQTPVNQLYFPPLTGTTWETTTPESLSWNTAALPDVYSYLDANNSKAFIVLKDGKIVLERYAGMNISNTARFTSSSQWYWASAGKTIAATLAGIAQEEGFLNINAPVSRYLGPGWTSAPRVKEDLITVRDQLRMTTGLDYTRGNLGCTTPACLQYRTDAGTQWYYHNAPYTLIHEVTAQATGVNYDSYTNSRLEEKIGMNGEWRSIDDNEVYFSTARDAARFGLLTLAKGTWDTTRVLSDMTYQTGMTTSSQSLNASYGYLWWLNGKGSVMFPGLSAPVASDITPQAPDDMISALGKNGQIIDVIPSLNMVVIRMGNAMDNAAIPIIFHDELWELLNVVLGR